jgi:hypothetical protein
LNAAAAAAAGTASVKLIGKITAEAWPPRTGKKKKSFSSCVPFVLPKNSENPEQD